MRATTALADRYATSRAHRRSLLLRLPWIVASLAAASCRDGGPRADIATHESSGVLVVANLATASSDSGCITLDSAPALAIGGAGAEGPYDLLGASALRLSDGGIVVLNRQTRELRFFDVRGHFIRSVGRAGTGPGEFRNPIVMAWFGRDTIAVQDFTLYRITLLSPEGAVIGTIHLRGVFAAVLLGRLADGSMVFSARSSIPPGNRTGRWRGPVYLIRVSSQGRILDTLEAFPGPEALIYRQADGEAGTVAPFGRNTYFAMGGGRVFAADNAEYRVRVYAGGRRLERIVSKSHVPRAPTPSDVERERIRFVEVARDPPSRRQLEAEFRAARPPGALPRHGRIAVDADGWLWVREWTNSLDSPAKWDVFDGAGRLRCTIALPVRFWEMEIGHEFLLGAHADEDGLQQVRLYRLRRGRRSAS